MMPENATEKDARSNSPPTFQMVGCREVSAFYAGSIHIENQISIIEKEVFGNPRLAFDVCKALVETVCKHILTERGAKPEITDSPQKLLKQALGLLQLVPDSHSNNAKVKEGLKKTVNGLQTVVQGLTEIRNEEGFASHGPNPFAASLGTLHAMMAARATDAVVYFLIGAHRAGFTKSETPEINYNDNPEFNNELDAVIGLVKILDIQFRPSEIVFTLRNKTYHDALADYLASEENAQAAAVE